MATHSSFITKVITAGSFVVAAALIAPTSVLAEGGHDSTTEKGHSGKGGSDKGHKGSGGSGTSHGKATIVKGSEADTKGKKGSSTKAWSHDGMVNAGVDVELGRLNASRAPQKVLDQQIFELLKNIAAAGQTTLIGSYPLYTGSTTLATVDDPNTPYDDTTQIGALANSIYISSTRVVKVDSPLSNLALFKEVLLNNLTTTSEFTKKGDGGSTTLSASTLFTGISFDKFELASIFLAVAADKEAGIELGTVKGVNLILGTNLTEAQMQQIATDAAILQEAIVYNHDTTD